MLKFAMAVMAVVIATALVSAALADHNNNPYWLVTYEYLDDYTGVELSDEFGPMAYDTGELCEQRGKALGKYLEEHTEVIGVVTCLHSYGEPIEVIIGRVGQYFADRLPPVPPAVVKPSI